MVVALAVGWALFPESVVGAVTLLAVGFSWASSDVTEVPVAALVAALGMLAAHVAATSCSYGPARLPVDPGVARLWALRGAGVFGAAVLVWVLARAVAELPDSGSVWVVGLVVALSVLVVAAAAIQAANPREDGERHRHRQRHRLGGVPRTGPRVRRAGAARSGDDVRRDRRGRRRPSWGAAARGWSAR